MADKLYALTEQDLHHFRELVAESQRRRANGSQVGIGGYIDEPQQASDVYIARTPSSGIPGLEEFAGTSPDEPGSASCQVYKLAQARGVGRYRVIKIPGLTKQVFNLTTRDVPGSAWIVISKLKGGQWVTTGNADEAITDEATGTGTGTGPDDPQDSPGGGSCTLARLKPGDCLRATGPENSAIMRPGGLGWVGDEELEYFDGSASGVVEFWYADGRVHLSVGGLELLDCGNGCFTGGPLTGHTRPGSDTSPPCQGEVFTVCVGCVCCSAPGFDGEGWYCVNTAETTGTSTVAEDCEPLYLTEEDACDSDIVICSGPYPSALAAALFCGTYQAGGPSDCGGAPTIAFGQVVAVDHRIDGVVGGGTTINRTYSLVVTPNTTYKVNVSGWFTSAIDRTEWDGQVIVDLPELIPQQTAEDVTSLPFPNLEETIEETCGEFTTGPAQTQVCVRLILSLACDPGFCMVEVHGAMTVTPGNC